MSTTADTNCGVRVARALGAVQRWTLRELCGNGPDRRQWTLVAALPWALAQERRGRSRDDLPSPSRSERESVYGAVRKLRHAGLIESATPESTTSRAGRFVDIDMLWVRLTERGYVECRRHGLGS